MAEFVYLLLEGTTKRKNGDWKTKQYYADYLLLKEGMDDSICLIQSKKERLFLMKFHATAHKHFIAWISTNLASCAIAGESILAAAICKWCLDGAMPSEALVFHSKEHKTWCDGVVSVKGYVNFIATHTSRADITALPFFQDHKQALQIPSMQQIPDFDRKLQEEFEGKQHGKRERKKAYNQHYRQSKKHNLNTMDSHSTSKF